MHIERFDPGPVPALALFVMRTEDGTHAGILHRAGGTLFVQDVLWHERFRSAPCPEPCPYHFVVPALELEELNDITAMCRLIHNRYHGAGPGRRPGIPYAFRRGTDTRFNREDGELTLGDGLGLTCSTFILTVFESVRVTLVDFDGWPIRADDDRRHGELLDLMKRGVPGHGIPPAEPEHVARVAEQLPCIRVRPEEVAAAAMFDDLPATFPQLEPAGRWILQRLSSPAPRGR
jgi:hypothetical protein